MVNETAKVNVTLNNQEAQQKLEELQGEMKRLIELKKKAEEAGDVEGYKLIDKELKKTTRSAKSLVNQHRDLEATLKNLNGVSLNELETAKRTLLNRVKSLKQGTVEWKKEAGNLSRVTSQISKVKTEMGLLQSPMQKALSFAKGLLPAFSFGVVLAGMTRFVRKMNEAAKVADDFNERLDNLSALTGLEGRELEELGDIAKKTSVKITEGGVLIKQSADDIVDAYTKVGSQRPELLKNAEALASVTEDAIILSEAAKSDLAPAVAGLTTTMNQFNIGAEGSKRIINAMAAGSKAGAADIPYLTEAVEKSGTTMHLMNISLEENIGLIETIAPNYAKASLAGNSLDKVFLKLKEKQIGYKDGVFSVNAALEELEVRYKNGESAATIFGVEHAKMGELLVQNKAEFNRYTEAVTGTNVAIEQAVKNTSNNKAIQAQARNEYHLAAIELGNNLSPAMTRLYKVAGSVASAFSKMIASSPAESLQKERSEVNLLVDSITLANNTQETRNALVAELQRKYPDFLKNLDTEKLTNEQLRDRLKEVNNEYESKILLAIKEDALKENYKERMELKLAELDALKQIAKYENIAAEARTKIAGETDPTKYRSLLSDGEIAALNAMDLLPKKLQIIRSRFSELITEEIELNKAILGLTSKNLTPTTDPAIGSLKTVGNVVYEWDGKTWNFKENIGGGGGLLPTSFAEITEGEVFDYAAIDAEMAAEAERFAEKARNEEEWTDFLNQQIKERLGNEAKAFKTEEEINEAREQLKVAYAGAISQIAGALASMFKEGSAAQIAAIAVEKSAAIAQIIFQTGIANAKAAAASPLTFGQPWVTINTINAAASIAGIVGTTISSFKDKKNNDKPGYADGKYPRLQTGMYGNEPHYALFNEVPGQPETVIDGLTTRDINLNYPEIMDAIYAVRDGRVPGYANGKYPVKSILGSENSEQMNTSGIDQQTAKELTIALNRFANKEFSISVQEFKQHEKTYEDIMSKINF